MSLEAASVAAPTRRVLVIDNYDSFVFNLVHYIAQLGAQVEVKRNDEITVAEIKAAEYDGVVLSPGPGKPEDAGICVEAVTAIGSSTPLLGVCLGHQAIGVAFGGVVGPAEELLHGKTSLVHHVGAGVFAGLPDPFIATRYHSLAIESDTVPVTIEVTARTASGIIMGVRHRDLPIEGVQFHPESVLTVGGHQLIANWLTTVGVQGAQARVADLSARLEKQRDGAAALTAPVS